MEILDILSMSPESEKELAGMFVESDLALIRAVGDGSISAGLRLHLDELRSDMLVEVGSNSEAEWRITAAGKRARVT